MKFPEAIRLLPAHRTDKMPLSWHHFTPAPKLSGASRLARTGTGPGGAPRGPAAGEPAAAGEPPGTAGPGWSFGGAARPACKSRVIPANPDLFTASARHAVWVSAAVKICRCRRFFENTG